MVEQVTFQTIFQFLQTVGILVGVYYYITTIRSTKKNQEMQLETRQAQLFMQIYREDLGIAEKGPYGMIGVIEWNFNDYDDFNEKFGPDSNPDAYQSYIYLLYIMEGIGVLVREGYVDIRLIALLSSGMVKNLWMKLQPIIYEERKRRNWPRWSIEFEYLYDTLIDYAEKHPKLQL
jgi:hypothetical protein